MMYIKLCMKFRRGCRELYVLELPFCVLYLVKRVKSITTASKEMTIKIQTCRMN